MSRVSVPGHSRQQIKQLADSIRKFSQIPPGTPFPIIWVIEMMGVPFEERGPSRDGVPYLEYQLVPDEELEDCYAEFRPFSNMLLIRQSVYDGAYAGNGRDRFTLAHELGHVLLHGTNNFRLARNDKAIPSYQDPEWQANTFASMLLIPRDEILGMSIEDITTRYKVSKSAAEIALKQVKKPA